MQSKSSAGLGALGAHIGCMLRRMACLAVVVLLAGAAPTVCRPTPLGSLACSGPAARPEPRPPYVGNRGLDQMRPPVDPADRGSVFVPARDTDRLGNTVTDGPLPGTCRPDRLGNASCR